MQKGKSVVVFAGLRIKDEFCQEFARRAKSVVDNTRKEQGCIKYDLLRDVYSPDTFFFFEEMPKPTKGTIYLDTSKKGVTKFKTRRHNSYRAEVTYNGVKYRKRSAERADCEQFLAQLAEKYEKGLL